MNPLAWYNLIFLVPLALGIVLVLGAAFGLGDMHHGPEMELHHGLDLDGDGEPDIVNPLLYVGFGRAPLALVLSILLLTFGGSGTALNFFLAPLLEKSGMFAVLSLGAAVFVMSTSTRAITRLVAKYMPTTETTSTTRYDLIGCAGKILLTTDRSGGIAQVRQGGDLFQVGVWCEKKLPAGTQVLLTAYDEQKNVYEVVPDPSVAAD